MFILKRWDLIITEKDLVRAEGLVFNNSKYSEGNTIIIFIIKQCKVVQQSIVITTSDEASYELKFEECCPLVEERTKKCMQILGITEDAWQECLSAKKAAEAQFLHKIDTLLKSKELFIQIAGNTALAAFYKSKDEIKRVLLDYCVHSFQDYVLIKDAEQVFFRFFPLDDDQIELDFWDDGLEKVYFENIGRVAEYKSNTITVALESNSIVRIDAV